MSKFLPSSDCVNYYTVIGPIVVVSNLAPLVAAWLRRSVLSRTDRPFLFYLAIYVTSGFVQYALAMRGINNWWVIHVTTLGEFVCAGWLYASWEPSRAIARLIRAIVLLYGIFWIVAKLTFEPMSGNAPYSAAGAELLLVAASLYMLFQLADRLDVPLEQSMRFWITTALLLSSASDLFLWTLLPLLLEVTHSILSFALIISWIRVLIANFLFIRGLWCNPLPVPGGPLRSAL